MQSGNSAPKRTESAGPQSPRVSLKRLRAGGRRFLSDAADPVAGLAVGLPQLRIELPRIALDPWGGDGALSRGLSPFGIDVRLTDLYPRHPAADGYVTRELLDAGHAESLRFSLEQSGRKLPGDHHQ
jgi:hypothetical protein